MASLTYLNEASVLHNLRQRYYSSLIYVCVQRGKSCKLSYHKVLENEQLLASSKYYCFLIAERMLSCANGIGTLFAKCLPQGLFFWPTPMGFLCFHDNAKNT